MQPVRAKDRFLVFGSPAITDEEVEEIVKVMKSGWLGTGPRAAQFERDVAAYKGGGHPVALNSCTAALHLSMLACDLKPGDEVITTPMTFCATVNTIIHAGATPVLADVNPTTMNIDPAEIEKKITPRTRIIIPVHFAGRACDMDAIVAIAKKHNLRIVEDCAHAIETTWKGKPAGLFGDFGCFSFYVTKNVTTGEGGMVLARDEKLAARIKVLGLHGMSKDAWKRFGDEGYKHYAVVAAGFKYNLTDLASAIGSAQLKRVEPYWQRRAVIWNRFNQAFADLPVILPAPPEPGSKHAYHLYTPLIDQSRAKVTRDQFLDRMTFHNIGVGVHYQSLPEHPYYQQTLGWRPEQFPHAMKIGRETVSIPLSAKLSDADVEDVIRAVKLSLTA
jgi:dTDP-4-amino-4,6-dideoxygalactose transaminase